MVKQIKDTAKESIEFSKQLGRLLFSAAFLFLAGYGIYQGRQKIAVVALASALVFSGVVVGFAGLYQLYKTLSHKAA